MRINPEDYAFLASYSSARVLKAAQERAWRLKGALLSIVIGVVIMGYWWFQGGRARPSDPMTWHWIALFAVAVVVTVAAGVVALTTAKKGVRTPNVVAHFALLVALIAPVVAWWLLWWRLRSLDTGVATTGWPRALAITVLALAIAGSAGVAAAVVLGVRWVRSGYGLGWAARQLGRIATLVALGPGVLFAIAWFAVGSRLNSDVYGWLNDKQIWMICGVIAVTVIVVGNAAQQSADMGILASAVRDRPALRIDPLGLILDDSALGAVRVPWQYVRSIGAKARGLMPGPQLRVRREGAPDWLVPLSYLDCMPGTIDSAIRAHTQDRRSLDLSALDKVF